MEWPSKSVPHGGILHPAKVQYSAETKNFLNLLMEESRISNNIRQKVNYNLRNGDPLPQLHSDRGDYRKRIRQPPIIIRPGTCRRRTQHEIMQSGAYEREKFVPDRSKEDREEVKKRLQNTMAFGKNGPPKIGPNKTQSHKPVTETPETNKFDDLMQEIKERQEWLKQMEDLGEGHKYREVINLQIQAKLREMDKLKSDGKCSTRKKK